jgi:hypothetical protein
MTALQIQPFAYLHNQLTEAWGWLITQNDSKIYTDESKVARVDTKTMASKRHVHAARAAVS